jgi:hypothetical protein
MHFVCVESNGSYRESETHEGNQVQDSEEGVHCRYKLLQEGQ